MAENSNNTLIAHGQVEIVESKSSVDDSGGWRVKIRLDSDGPGKSASDIPWAFPLNTSFIHAVPQVGEGAFVLIAQLGKTDSQRYYLGPIISQPQFLEYCSYLGGRGDAVSLLGGAKPAHNDPLTSINRAEGTTKGSFPDVKDIAILGRGQEDIILKYRGNRDGVINPISEIDLRAGIKLKPADSSVKYFQGNIAFNSEDPAYIQIKRQVGYCGNKQGSGDAIEDKYEGTDKRESNSVVNIVAGKINLISTKDTNSFGEAITDRDELVKQSQIDEIMSNLHRSVYGDELVTLLKLIVNVLRTHTHPYSMLSPTEGGTDLEELAAYNFEKILSPHVRLS